MLANEVVQLDPVLAAQLSGIIVPIIVAVIAKKLASPALKAVLNAVLSVIAGALATAAAATGEVDITQILNGVMWAAITSWASYYGFWKPTTIAPKVQDATAGFGVGAPAGIPPDA